MQVVILCGGMGTRLRERTQEIPKPLIDIGGRPILWHVMKTYAHHGYRDFLLCLGYKGEKIEQYFANTEAAQKEGWAIHFVDTGLETNTGGRIKRIEGLISGERFFATYADGLADIDLEALLSFHRSHRKIATITAVQPLSPFGLLQLGNDGQVVRFQEKPQLQEWVNGGFFVFEREIFNYLTEDSILEREPFEVLAREGQIMAYKHLGFWRCMDTYKDTITLNSLWQARRAPWKVWRA